MNPTNNFQATTPSINGATSQRVMKQKRDRKAPGLVTTRGNMATSRTNLQPASTCCNPRVLRESSDLLLYKLKNGMARLLKHDASRVKIRWQADAFVKKVIEYWASNVSARKGTIQLIKATQLKCRPLRAVRL
jgi:hypothetical protein